MHEQKDVLNFWLNDVPEEDWYSCIPALDAQIRLRFESLWRRAVRGELRDWWKTPKGSLAFIILTDQFSRNMFRNHAYSYATDAIALKCARNAVSWNFDMSVPKYGREFFYTPFIHSESLEDQEMCAALTLARLKEDPHAPIPHVWAHHQQIQDFGRFPARNVALGRTSTQQEVAFLKRGGYATLVEEIRQMQAA